MSIINNKRSHNFLRYEEKYFALKNYFENDIPLTELASTLGVGDSTVRNWLNKIEFDFTNIERLKRLKPTYDNRRNPIHTDLPDWVKNEILTIKKQHPTMGALKLKQYFFRSHQVILSEKKIYFFLKQNGLVSERKKNTEKKKHDRSFEYSSPMEAVQVDLLTITLTGNQKVYLVTFLADYSRFILLSEYIPVKSMTGVIKLLTKVVKKYGVMNYIICDKGSEFVSWQSFTEFENLLCALDVELIASGPDTPQNQGKIERWHKTFRNDCERAHKGFTYQAEAQYKTDSFVNYYNYERPHQAIGGLFPADRFYGLADELENELQNYVNGNREEQCIYFSCNIKGKKMVVSGPRDNKLSIYQNIEEDTWQKN